MASRLPAEERKHQLLHTARRVFAAKGFHDTSMDEVAEAAGVTKPVLYQHFPSKRALFVDVLTDIGDHLLAEFRDIMATADSPRRRVENGFRAYFTFLAEHPHAYRLLFGASVRHDDDFAEIIDRVVDRMSDEVMPLIDVAISTDQRWVLAHALVGMAESVGRRILATPDTHRDPATLAQWMMELAWFGMRGIRSGDISTQELGR